MIKVNNAIVLCIFCVLACGIVLYAMFSAKTNALAEEVYNLREQQACLSTETDAIKVELGDVTDTLLDCKDRVETLEDNVVLGSVVKSDEANNEANVVPYDVAIEFIPVEETAEPEQPKVLPPKDQHLTRQSGVFYGESGKETYYNLNMSGVVSIMRNMGYTEEEYPYWVRDDGVKMLGDYVMVACDFGIRPRGTIVETSLGTALVCDTGGFATRSSTLIDIAVTW